MKILIRDQAAANLETIFDWIAKDNPRAAANVVRRLRERIGQLAAAGMAEMGRTGHVRSTRELVEPPYVIVYRVDSSDRKSRSLEFSTARRNDDTILYVQCGWSPGLRIVSRSTISRKPRKRRSNAGGQSATPRTISGLW